MFIIKATVRGSLVDIVLQCKIDPRVAVALQIATALQCNGRGFSFHKTVLYIIKCLGLNITILLIGMVGDKVAGVYMIPPTAKVKKMFAEFQGATNFNVSMLNKKTAQDGSLGKFLEQFRYLTPEFKEVVQGLSQDINMLSGDLFDVFADEFHTVTNTPEHWLSLFNDNSHAKRTEWAGNVAFETNVASVAGIVQHYIHGGRGDVEMDFGDFKHKDERKTLRVNHAENPKSNAWAHPIREPGQRGLHPSEVSLTTASVRRDRKMVTPANPTDLIGMVLLATVTESGNIGIRPDNPAANHLYMNFNLSQRSNYVDFDANVIGNDMYPEHMRELFTCPKTGDSKIRFKAVFYYKDLYPGSPRLAELMEVYRLFANRQPTEDAINAYESVVTDELIDDEIMAKRNRKKATTVQETVVVVENEEEDE